LSLNNELINATLSAWNRTQNSVFERRISRKGSISEQLCFNIGVMFGTIVQIQ